MSTARTGTTSAATGFQGNDKLLLGIVLGVVSFWLFAGTAGTVAPNILADINSGGTEYLSVPAMNLAVSVTALFSGMFIVVFGGFADRFGRVKIALIGNALNIVGAALLVFASGSLALPLLLVGRALQGLSAACIMPATMALLKAYWDGPARQRAVSMWSIGSWGGSGLAAIFGGTVIQTLGSWRWIFILAIVVSVIAIVLMLGTPESRVASAAGKRTDVAGIVLLAVSMLALLVVLIFGSQLGWTSPTVLILAVVAIVGTTALVALSVILLLPTHLLLAQYQWLAVIAYCLFGLGLAFYATPSTDVALSNLPADQAGSGIYKMASSLGNAIGTAISLALFTAFSALVSASDYIGTVLSYEGRVDNVAVRTGGAIALGLNLLIVVLAIISIMVTIPKHTAKEKEQASA